MTDIVTMNLSDTNDGMVSLNNNQGTSFVSKKPPEKNIESQQTMDSTPISDIMGQAEDPLEPPMMAQDPRMTQMQMQMPMMMAQQQQQVAPQQTTQKTTESKNPFGLTDDQFEALIVAVCAAVAISKPVQEKLVNFVPSFLNEQGNRSAIGLVSTGMVAAVAFYIAKRYA
jgi:hypothetical protein